MRTSKFLTAVFTLLLSVCGVAAADGWRVDLSPHTATATLIGRERVYAFCPINPHDTLPPASQPDDPAEPAEFGQARDFDGRLAIVCFDARTGARRWQRRTAARFRFVVAADDSLWGAGRRLVHFDADTGRTLLLKDVARDDTDRVAALRVGAELLALPDEAGRPVGRTRDGRPGRVLDATSGAIADTVLPSPARSPDGRWRSGVTLHQSPDDVTTTFVAEPLPTADDPAPQRKGWSFATRGYAANDPVWLGGDALVLSGTHDTQATVTRIAGDTGRVKWAALLPGGAYSAEHVYLRGNTHLTHQWDAVGEVGGRVAAVNGRGVVSFLDADSGVIETQFAGVDKPLAFPRRCGEVVVFVGKSALVGVPAATLLGDPAMDEPRRAAGRNTARDLLASNRPNEATAVARSLAEAGPADAGAWTILAEIAESRHDDSAALLAQVRAVMAAGGATSPALAARGVVRVVPSGPVTAAVVPWPPLVIVGTTDGELIRLNAADGAAVTEERVDGDIATLSVRGNTLFRRGSDRHTQEVAILLGPPLALPAGDPLRPSNEPPGAPHDWYTETGYDGPVVERDGRRYRPLHGGGVRVLDGNVVRTLPAKLPIESWRIHPGPTGPLGYGSGGVYRLDDDLVPVEKIVDAGTRRGGRDPYAVSMLATDGKTLAVMIYKSESSVLQVWSADGKTKLREEAAAFGGDDRNPLRLTPLGGGYLFAGDELVWISPDSQRPAWRFALQPPPRRGMRHQELDDLGFGAPRVIGERAFATCNDGGVFVFDVPTITGGGK